MWQRKTSFFLLALACFSLLCLAPLPGESYLITGSEITQIQDECATLRIELSILKANSEADRASLKRLGESLQKAEDSLSQAEKSLTISQAALTSALEQLEEVRTQLAELKASLAKSKRAELWKRLEIGGACLLVGAGVGVIIGLLVD